MKGYLDISLFAAVIKSITFRFVSGLNEGHAVTAKLA
jgi:hypothetical protein